MRSYMLILFLFAVVSPSYARIGETHKQAIKRYGKITRIVKPGFSYEFRKVPYDIGIINSENRVVVINYRRMRNKLGKREDVSSNEIKLLLARNGGNATWVRDTRTKELRWVTLDGKLRARYFSKFKSLIITDLYSILKNSKRNQVDKNISQGSNNDCGGSRQQIIKATKTMSSKNLVYSLKNNGETSYVLFLSSYDKRVKSSKKGEYMPWRLLERKKGSYKYCVIGKGYWVEQTMSLHGGVKFRNNYGLNVPGKKRCADSGIESVLDLQYSANKLVGKAFIHHLNSDDGERNYIFMSGHALKWVIIKTRYKKNMMRACYHAKGNDMSISKNLK